MVSVSSHWWLALGSELIWRQSASLARQARVPEEESLCRSLEMTLHKPDFNPVFPPTRCKEVYLHWTQKKGCKESGVAASWGSLAPVWTSALLSQLQSCCSSTHNPPLSLSWNSLLLHCELRAMWLHFAMHKMTKTALHSFEDIFLFFSSTELLTTI